MSVGRVSLGNGQVAGGVEVRARTCCARVVARRGLGAPAALRHVISWYIIPKHDLQYKDLQTEIISHFSIVEPEQYTASIIYLEIICCAAMTRPVLSSDVPTLSCQSKSIFTWTPSLTTLDSKTHLPASIPFRSIGTAPALSGHLQRSAERIDPVIRQCRHP